MKTSMNFTTSIYDADRFTDADDLQPSKNWCSGSIPVT